MTSEARGYVKLEFITADNEGVGISATTKITNVTMLDKFAMLNALMQALEMGAEDLAIYMILHPVIESGISRVEADIAAIQDLFGYDGDGDEDE